MYVGKCFGNIQPISLSKVTRKDEEKKTAFLQVPFGLPLLTQAFFFRLAGIFGPKEIEI